MGIRLKLITILLTMIGVFSLHHPLWASELPNGVQPLMVLSDNSLESFIPVNARLINEAKEVEQFLKTLDHNPPDWAYLYGSNVDERYDRLFDEMEKRDAARLGNPALLQRIVFLWYGALTSFREQHKGFGVAIGPEKMRTTWGFVRFKLAEQPYEMVAVPPPKLLETFKDKRSQGKSIEIKILFIGKLIPEESLLYDFSTDEEGTGMIMPIVELEEVKYILE